MINNYHKNPRQITRKRFDALRKSLAKLGDLGGIVHDLNSGEIIGGNQRSNVFDLNACDVEIVQQLETPDEQGTVAHGFVLWQGKRYAYRQVRWSPEWCEEANVLANLAGGTWDFETFANSWDSGKLIEWGMDDDLLKDWSKDIAGLNQLIASESVLSENDAFGALPDEDRAPFQQMTFTLHDTQAEQVREAMKIAEALGPFVDSENENSNGNALARICEIFITEHGDS